MGNICLGLYCQSPYGSAMPKSQPIPELSHLPQDSSQLGSTRPSRREEPWASGQRKRYLASLEATDQAS